MKLPETTDENLLSDQQIREKKQNARKARKEAAKLLGKKGAVSGSYSYQPDEDGRILDDEPSSKKNQEDSGAYRIGEGEADHLEEVVDVKKAKRNSDIQALRTKVAQKVNDRARLERADTMVLPETAIIPREFKK